MEINPRIFEHSCSLKTPKRTPNVSFVKLRNSMRIKRLVISQLKEVLWSMALLTASKYSYYFSIDIILTHEGSIDIKNLVIWQHLLH